jgi:antagonist of KipI
MTVRITEAGDSALLLELDSVIDAGVNARAIAIAAAMRDARVPGVRDVVSTFRSVAVYFDPLSAAVDVVRGSLERVSDAAGEATTGRTVEVPVTYGGELGPDLPDVAAFARLTPDAVIERHTAGDYRVFMLGFLPGFAYMGSVPAEIAAPRRATPRLRVPGGSVGIAGRQTAVYPRDSPGGWQIVGRTSKAVFDPAKMPAALFAPGDTVRFVREGPADVVSGFNQTTSLVRSKADTTAVSRRSVSVLRPGLLTTIQDSGRWGHQSSGIPVSGAMDAVSHRLANALVGNDRAAATLEATLAGPELRIDCQAVVAVTGADLGATVDGAAVPLNMPTPCRPGSVLRFGERRQGARAYIAFDGGVAVAATLGSRATHTTSGLGGLDGRALLAGDRIALGDAASAAVRRHVDRPRLAVARGVSLRVLAGPQHDFFDDAAYEVLQRSRFRITPQSDRMGYRLEGPPIPGIRDREMISDATFGGAIQVPASGEPILLMADRQTTGGYPQIAIVISADLPLAAQLAPGDWVEFRICSRGEAVAALVAQEGKLLAIG